MLKQHEEKMFIQIENMHKTMDSIKKSDSYLKWNSISLLIDADQSHNIDAKHQVSHI